MASTINDVQAALGVLGETVTLIQTDVTALAAKGTIDLDPVVSAIAALNTALMTLDAAVKTALG